ncbi:glycosyltransferase family 2 protein [Aestuariivivens sediminis]|uniref:glycosyltransferase family 2 protein n=1 Tax=Aestuariivivens sediminis TaxID=2913557 RepID=UPI001F59CA82|nr:glycosyltransferase family A protein [Aestuariivivens sediminis]
MGKLPDTILNQLIPDTHYLSKQAQAYDLSWQAIQSGFVGEVPTYTVFEALSTRDNYHFIRKYFHPAWVLYVLFLRLVSFHNPVKEICAWYTTRGIKQVQFGSRPICHPKWQTYDYHILKNCPKVSVIIPTLNRYEHLKAILQDLEQQDYKNFEIIVVDQSTPFDPSFYNAFNLDIQLIRQEAKALWLARNTAVKRAKGALIALSEDDVRIQPDWISNHLKCLEYFKAEVSAGVFYPKGKSIPKARSFFAVASQFATGNAMLYKHVFNTVGLFDRQFEKQRMGDGEFGLRVYLSGIKSISNPIASCVDVKASTGGLRELGSWDAFRPSKFFAPRPIPSVLYFYRRYFGNGAARLALLRTIPLSIVPYQFKKNRSLLILGGIISVLFLPFVCYQVYRSWHLSGKKLKQGPLIDVLE